MVKVLREACVASILAAALFATTEASAATLEVGPGKTYATPCAAIMSAAAGDTIEVDAAGSYNGDTCSWSTDGLTITGVNGRAKIDLTGVTPSGQKGIFTIEGTASATIENFELSGAAIASSAGNNGAGIRHQGLNLTVRNCYIHDNQDGILGGPATANTGTVLIENSEFYNNGAGDGFSHNMYIGDYAKFILQYSYSHHANVGHLVKSRAYTTFVGYNRLTDESGGTASYETDIPNGGTAYVIGNLIEQSPTSQNPTIVTFAEEGTPTGYDTHLFVVNNTILNDLGSGTFVADSTSTPALLVNNIFYNGGTVSSQASATLTTNFTGNPLFVDEASFNVNLMGASPCINAGTTPGSNGSQSLVPTFEYVQPLSDVARSIVGSAIDIGAYEFGLAEDAGAPVEDASIDGGAMSSDGGGGSPMEDASFDGGLTGSDGGSLGGMDAGSDASVPDAGRGIPSPAPESAGKSSGGCGCAVAGTNATVGEELLALLLLAVAFLVRRRGAARAR